MKRRWILRLAVTAGAYVVTVTVMVLAGMDPRPALLAGVAGACAVCYWLTADVAVAVRPARWTVHRAEARSRGDDSRVQHLRWRLEARPESDDGLDSCAPLLIDLLDDRVAATYGIDREQDPDGYARVVGPQLAAFVAAPPTGARARNPAVLADLLTRIESL